MSIPEFCGKSVPGSPGHPYQKIAPRTLRLSQAVTPGAPDFQNLSIKMRQMLVALKVPPTVCWLGLAGSSSPAQGGLWLRSPAPEPSRVALPGLAQGALTFGQALRRAPMGDLRGRKQRESSMPRLAGVPRAEDPAERAGGTVILEAYRKPGRVFPGLELRL